MSSLTKEQLSKQHYDEYNHFKTKFLNCIDDINWMLTVNADNINLFTLVKKVNAMYIFKKSLNIKAMELLENKLSFYDLDCDNIICKIEFPDFLSTTNKDPYNFDGYFDKLDFDIFDNYDQNNMSSTYYNVKQMKKLLTLMLANIDNKINANSYKDKIKQRFTLMYLCKMLWPKCKNKIMCSRTVENKLLKQKNTILEHIRRINGYYEYLREMDRISKK